MVDLRATFGRGLICAGKTNRCVSQVRVLLHDLIQKLRGSFIWPVRVICYSLISLLLSGVPVVSYAETIGAIASAVGTIQTSATFKFAASPTSTMYDTFTAYCDARRASWSSIRPLGSCSDKQYSPLPVNGGDSAGICYFQRMWWGTLVCEYLIEGAIYYFCPVDYHVWTIDHTKCVNSKVMYSCPSNQNWTLSGTTCTRPDNTCPVKPLTAPPFNDACAQALENISSTQAQKNAACGSLTPAMQAGKSCLEGKLSSMSPAIPLAITADIRNIAYQAHLREIWDKMEILVPLMKNDPNMQIACATRRAEIAAEKGCDNAGICTSCYSESTTQRSHCLKGMPARASENDAQHIRRNAIDVSEVRTIVPLKRALGTLRPSQTITQFLDAPANCNLIWGGTFTNNYDPVHFFAR